MGGVKNIEESIGMTNKIWDGRGSLEEIIFVFPLYLQRRTGAF